MSRLELSRGNKGLWQRVEALWRSMLPRQARVTRTDGSTAWVRFVDEGNDAPESQFPSTVAGVPAGTVGWVSTLGGKKGLFVATGISGSRSRRGAQNLTSTRTTAGDIDFSSTVDPLGSVPGSKVTGLKPNTVYQVTTTLMIAATSDSSGSWRAVVKFPTGGTDWASGFTVSALGLEVWQWTGEITSNAAGEISAHPSIRWVSGSITSSRAEIILRVEQA